MDPIPDAHMPFLLADYKERGLLMTRPLPPLTVPCDAAAQNSLFREPWLSNPKYDKHRARTLPTLQHEFTHHAYRSVLRVGGEDSPLDWITGDYADMSECSPWMANGMAGVVLTLRTGCETRLIPLQSLVPGGELEPITIPGIKHHAPRHGVIWSEAIVTDGVEEDLYVYKNGIVYAGTLSAEGRVERIVPLDGNRVIFTTSPVPVGHTYVLDLHRLALQELLVEGQPVYKSHLRQNLCAYVKREGAGRSIHFSTDFELVDYPHVTWTERAPDQAAVRRPSDPKVEQFFDLNVPCWFGGCEKLRAEFAREAEDPACQGCGQTKLQRRYRERVIKAMSK